MIALLLILVLQPEDFTALFKRGYELYRRNQFAEAEPLLAQAVKLNPNDFNARYLLGASCSQLHRNLDALRQWREALRLQPKNVKLMQIMIVEYGKGNYFQESCALSQRALALSAADQSVHFLAIKACQDARDPVALDLARRAARKFPESARASFEYGFQLQRLGQSEQAVAYLKNAMSADPNYEEPFFFYGDLMSKLDRYEEALEPLRAAIRIRPDYVPAYLSLARALMSLKRNQDAVNVLEQAGAASPNHAQPHLLLSQLYFRMGEEDRARKERDISMRLRREHPEAMEDPQSRPFPQ